MSFWLALVTILIAGNEATAPPQLSQAEIADLFRRLGSLNVKLASKPVTDGDPVCKAGLEYEASSGYCVDIDECQRGLHNCSHVSLCINQAGSFLCAPSPRRIPRCPEGYTLNWHLQECLDTDECSKEPCPQSKVCINERSSFKCLDRTRRLCPPGYFYEDGKGCQDVNECEGDVENLCDSPSEICGNLHGSYMCLPPCKRGFRMLPKLWECADIDECAEQTDGCALNEECVNTLGGFDCKRNPDAPSTSKASP